MSARSPPQEQPLDEVQPEEEVESDESRSLSDQDQDKEYMVIDLSNLKELKELECAICRGTIRNTRALMECLHRFCKDCIEKSMGLGINECPVCHVQIASQESLKEDPSYDNIISIFVPHMEKNKEQEKVALHDDGRTHDEESNTRVSSETSRSIRLSKFIDHLRNSYSNERNTLFGGENCSSSRFSTFVDHLRNSHDDESNTQVSGENSRSTRLSKFVEHLLNSDVNDDELEIHLVVVSLDEQMIPSLQQPYLLCKPTCSVNTLCKYVALKVEMPVDQVELFLVEESEVNILRGEITVDPEKDKLRALRDEETLAQIYTPNVTNSGHLILGYKMK